MLLPTFLLHLSDPLLALLLLLLLLLQMPAQLVSLFLTVFQVLLQSARQQSHTNQQDSPSYLDVVTAKLVSNPKTSKPA